MPYSQCEGVDLYYRDVGDGQPIVFDALTRDYRETLPDVDISTLVCAGADEKRGTVAAVRNVASLVPDARFELFEDSGHCPHVEEPERFNRVLRRFVESL
jgi:pimeloyl-ACP methyl ester carboxylesterase